MFTAGAGAAGENAFGIARRPDARPVLAVAIFSILLAACLLARLHLVFVYEINWDEFLNLSMVHDYARGELHEVLQTVFVHGFFWLDRVSANEVDQIVATRVLIYVLGLATAAFLFLICRQFLPVHAAMFAVVCYLAFSFVLRQGNSFRTDLIAACLLMAALWIITCRPPRICDGIIAGGLVGLAGMVTIKAIFYTPTIAIILLARLLDPERRRTALRHGAVTAAASLLGFLAFYALHRLSLPDPASTVAFLERTTGKTLGGPAVTDAASTFGVALIQNPLFWGAALLGLVACVRRLAVSDGPGAARWAGLAAFALPLGSLLVYSETYLYYYPFMLAPVAVLCGVGFASLPARLWPTASVVSGAILGLALYSQYASLIQRGNAHQRRTLEVVHRAFPEPTPYIDRCSMVSSYPKRGFFMSVWGMTDYYRRGVPVMRRILENDQPKFLIANRSMLALDDLGEGEYGPEHFGLFEQDVAVLKRNFIHHWGAIYVAGKRLALSRAEPSADFEILIEGPYTVESPVPVVLDGQPVRPGDVVSLERGMHRLEATANEPAAVTLRWGDHLYRPAEPANPAPLFTGF